MDDVVGVLARERRAMEHLAFRLHHARSVVAAGDGRFLALVADELEAAAHTVREVEAARATVIGDTREASLRELIDTAPAPYRGLLEEHQAALGRLAGEVGALVEATQTLAEDRLAEVRDGRPGRYRHTRRAAPLVDELDRAMAVAGYESVLAASDALRLPSLVTFLA